MAIELVFGRAFLKAARKLPKAQQNKLASLLETLPKDPFNTLLHTKPLTGRYSGAYSFRITREWRVLFEFMNPHTIHLFDVAHRKDIYR